MISKTTGYILGLLVFGSLNTLTTKIQFEMVSVGVDGKFKHFQKPWFGTLTMFLGMCIVLLIHFINVANRQRTKGSMDDKAARLLETGQQATVTAPSFWMSAKLISIPAILDLLATALCFIGLLVVPASVSQLMRASMIIFSAILSVLFLKRKLHGYHWFGVFLCTLAIGVVGYANMRAAAVVASNQPVGTPDESSMVLFGMGLIIVGQVVQASQVVFEEKLLRGYAIEPFHIVGMEGCVGSLAMIFIVFPILYFVPGSDAGGSSENIYDTYVMLKNSSSLQYLVLLYVFSVFTYNMSGMLVTYALSAVHRTMLEASRTAVIWIIDLLIHYYIAPSSSFGEVWTNWSWLQLIGFVILIAGQSVYSEMLRVPGFFYPPRPIVSHIESIQASPASVRYNVLIPEGCEEDSEIVMVLNEDKTL
jgi:drug/metabolite transporter (DMT)-like permease